MIRPITKEENRELAEMMLREDFFEEREREAAHRALPQDEQPWMVVCFGILSYKVIWIAPDASSESKALAERELSWWQQKAQRGQLAVKPLTSDVDPHDFQVRQQWDLDKLTTAIRESYR